MSSAGASRIVLIGAGSLCSSIVNGVLASGLSAQLILCGRASESSAARLAQLRAMHGASIETRTGDEETRRALSDASTALVVLCVKPNQVGTVASLLAGQPLPAHVSLLSCCAGVTVATLQAQFRTDRVARCMPNTAASLRASATAWFAATLPLAHVALIEELLGAFGTHMRVASECHIDVATALAGSGTAFVLLYMEAQVDAGVQLGLSLDQSRQLVVQTFLGSAKLAAANSGTHLAALRSHVVSPGGTTAAGLRQLERGGVRAGIADCINATFERAGELARNSVSPVNFSRGENA